MRQMDSKLLVILMTAYGTTQTAIEAMKLGAYDYLLKPFDVPKLKEIVANAFKAARDMRQVVSYQPLLEKEDYELGIVGRSEPMQQVFKLIGQLAVSDATALITGESGTGKELVARAIYHHSNRNGQPFLAVNCAAIPEQLLESELFGHERGAFTGASLQRIGKFEQCNHGTLFLDEIGDMTPATQTKVLRVLQSGTFERVGGNQPLKVDVRIIAATNKPLEQAVAARQFRAGPVLPPQCRAAAHLPVAGAAPARAMGDSLLQLEEMIFEKLLQKKEEINDKVRSSCRVEARKKVFHLIQNADDNRKELFSLLNQMRPAPKFVVDLSNLAEGEKGSKIREQLFEAIDKKYPPETGTRAGRSKKYTGLFRIDCCTASRNRTREDR